nr:MAG TPA: hypothetical protein [Caudoviricetes sp.]
MLLYHNSHKKKSLLVLQYKQAVFFDRAYSQKDLNTVSISHIQHFFNAFQPVAYRRPAVMRPCCNVRQRKPLNVPQ